MDTLKAVWKRILAFELCLCIILCTLSLNETLGSSKAAADGGAETTGGLIVTKYVTGSTGNHSREWRFVITLSDTSINGEYGDVTFHNGVAYFTLTDYGETGKTVKVKGLPAGVKYTVTEQESDHDGYSTNIQINGSPSDGEGNIIAGATGDLIFTNHRESCGCFIVKKEVTGSLGDREEVWNFTITLDNTSITGKYGHIYFNNGVAHFTLTDGDSVEVNGLPVGTHYTVTEDENNQNGYKTFIQEDSTGTNLFVFDGINDGEGTIQVDSTGTLTFTNNKEFGNLEVTKTVTGTAGEKNKEWNFTVTLDDTSINGTYGDMTFTNGSATFTLKDGESMAATGLMPGIAYTVTEEESGQNRYTTTIQEDGGDTGDSTTDGKGKILSDSTGTLTFTNNRDGGNLEVKKTVTGTAGETEKDWNFTVTLNDTSISGTYGDMTFANGSATFTLKHGQTKTAENLPAGITYTVTETEANSDDYSTTQSGDSGTIPANGTARAEFTNSKSLKTGSLAVKKTVAGNDGELEKLWNFTVELSDKAINGTYGDMTFTNGSATFTLKHNETKTAENLPADVTYTVTESEANRGGYTTSSKNDTGTIPANGTASAEFTNMRSKSQKTETTPGDGVPVEDGKEVTYRITYENASTDAMKIVITDPLDEGVDFVEASDGGQYDPATHTVTWTLENVLAGTPQSYVSLTVKVNAKAVKGDDQIENQAIVKFGNQPEVNTEKIVNRVESGGLTVKKTVKGSTGDKNADWHFTVELSDKAIDGIYGDMEFEDGVAKFTLKNGESKTARGLPAGVDYTVTETEADQNGYITNRSDEKGTIPDKNIAEAQFTNYKAEPHKTETSPGAGNAVGIGDTVTYQISYENVSTDAMKIVITDPLDEGVDYVTSSDKGQYDPATHTVTWTLENVQAGTKGQVSLTVKVNAKAETGGKQIKNQATVKFGNRSEVKTEEITNLVETGSLTVKKTVTGDAGRKDADWHFTVELNDKTITGIYGDMEFTEGVAEFTLKSGEHKTAKGLRAGITYTVTETEANQNGYTTAKTGEEGKILSGGEAVAEFTNDRHVPNKTEPYLDPGEPVRAGEIVTYQISYDNLGDTPITITIKDKLDEGVDFVDASDGGQYDPATRTVTWTLENVPALTVEPKLVTLRVRVNAQAVDGDQKIENKATVRYGSGPDIVTDTIQNPVETGDLTVRKTVEGSTGDKSADWNFTVELSDKTIQGTYGDMSFDKGISHFTLKDGDFKTARGLPAGVGYTVTETEADQNGYITNRSGEKGTIPEKGTAEAQFTNYKAEPHKTETSPGAGNAVGIGDTVTYQISYENVSTDAMKIVITDPLDEGVDYVTSSDKGQYDAAARTVTWTLENVQAGTKGQVTLTVKVNAKAATGDNQIVNQASVKFGNRSEVKTEEIINPIETGSLTVKKTVTGDAGRKDADWHFKVELSDKTITGTYGDMDFVEGIAEFTLKHGERKTASDLPAGVTYTVTEKEANQNGYTTAKTGEEDKILSGREAIAEFINDRHVPNKTETDPGPDEPVRVGEVVTYQISYDNKGDTPITITIKDKLDEGVDFVDASDGGQYDPATRTVTWTLKDVPALTVEPEVVTLRVRVNANALKDDKQIANQATVRYGSGLDIETDTIQNPVETGSLTVKKTVTGGAGDRIKDWHFTVELSDKTVQGTYGDMTFDKGVASFTLKDGESKTAEGLPAGVGYTVTEAEANQDGYITSWSGQEGTISANGKEEASFTNFKPEPHKTETSPGAGKTVGVGDEITYRISYENAGTDAMTIIITDPLDEGVDFVRASDDGQYDAATHTVTWTLKDVLAGTVGPQLVTLTVRVNAKAAAGNKPIENQAFVKFGNQSAVSTEKVTNPIGTGSLTVKKTVTGGAGDRNKNWNFTVELGDKTIQGTYGNMTFDKGVASFTLKDGESKTAEELPAGITYTVTEAEANQDGYTTSCEGETGVIPTDEEAVAGFMNFKPEPNKPETPPPEDKKDEPEMKSSPKTDGDAPFMRYAGILLSGTILLTGVYALRRKRKRR